MIGNTKAIAARVKMATSNMRRRKTIKRAPRKSFKDSRKMGGDLIPKPKGFGPQHLGLDRAKY